MVALPAAAVATFFFHAPVWAVYICVLSEEPLKMLIGLWRLNSGRWLNKVT
jgi:Na+-driven multidrug efflux pump